MSETLVVYDTELLVESGESATLTAVDAPETLVLTEIASEILVTPVPELLLETLEVPSVIVDAAPLEVVEIVTAGPQGPAGTNEDDMPYAKRVDFVGDTLLYRGEAVPGAAESSPAWRIQRLTFVGDDVTYEWAAGSAAFDKVWADRAALSYL